MSAGCPSQPLVVYIDDDHRARMAFERMFGSELRILTMGAAGLALLDSRHVAAVVVDAHVMRSAGEHVTEDGRATMTRIVVTKPWQQRELAQVLGTACAAWSHSMAQARVLSHDLRTPLMSLLVNADHLGALAEKVPSLRDALARVPLEPEPRRDLALILDELAPVAEDLERAARLVQQLIEQSGL